MFKSITNSLKKVFGTKYERDVKTYAPIVHEINEIFEGLQGLSNDELRNKTHEFRQTIADHLQGINDDIENIKQQTAEEEDLLEKENLFGEIDKLIEERDKHLEDILKEILPEAFAVVKETARRFSENETLEVTASDHDRELASNTNKGYVSIQGDKALWKNSWTAAGGEITWNMLHYDVQLIGGMVLHDGKIAEMATGEGKTLVATLPAYLNGLSGNGVHVITVNDYLARRDCEWVGPIFEFLFLTVDCIDKYRPHSEERKKAYLSDITYGTNNEYGFDYLRDNMVRSVDEMVQRKHHFTMIDEVDSVLIDDARTPLIISGPVPKGTEEQEYLALKPKVESLIAAQRKLATQYLTEAKQLFKEGKIGNQEGESGMALLRAYRALPKYRPLIKFLSGEGIKVNLQKAENFYMQEQSKNMHLVDEPLLFTIDEKNRNVELTELGSEFLARGSEDANFFILPDIATGMMEIDSNEELSKTELAEAKNKLAQDFAVKSKRLHSISQLLKAYTLFERDDEYVVIDGQVKIVDEQTGRMMEGRRYSDGLHQALEAKENVKVGDITQTYATVTLQNYFRMYHKLAGMTGTAETEASELWEIYKLDVVVIPTNRPIQRKDQEDLVYKTEREKFNAVIDDIVKLSGEGRPILVGTTSVDVSERLSRTLRLRGLDHNVLNAKQHQREAEVVAEAGKPGAVTIATNMACRGTDIKLGEGVVYEKCRVPAQLPSPSQGASISVSFGWRPHSKMLCLLCELQLQRGVLLLQIPQRRFQRRCRRTVGRAKPGHDWSSSNASLAHATELLLQALDSTNIYFGGQYAVRPGTTKCTNHLVWVRVNVHTCDPCQSLPPAQYEGPGRTLLGSMPGQVAAGHPSDSSVDHNLSAAAVAPRHTNASKLSWVIPSPHIAVSPPCNKAF